jgi:hypothetical protein
MVVGDSIFRKEIIIFNFQHNNRVVCKLEIVNFHIVFSEFNWGSLGASQEFEACVCRFSRVCDFQCFVCVCGCVVIDGFWVFVFLIGGVLGSSESRSV